MRKKTRKMILIEHSFGKDIKEILIDLYYKQDLTQEEVGKMLGVDATTISIWLVRLDLPQKEFTAKGLPEITGAS